MDNIRRVFRAKHWEVFSMFMTISFIQGISEGFNNAISIIFYILYIVLYIGWLLALGAGLKSMGQNSAFKFRLFLATGIGLITAIFFVRLLGAMGLFDNLESEGIGITMLTIILISLIILCSFIAKNLKIIEKGDDVDINDYFGDIFLLIFWPIGIWTIQPRLNKVAEKLAHR